MITRRRLIEAAGAGAALAGIVSGRPFAEGLNLPPALPEGMRGEATLEALPGKKPLIKLSLPAAELRNAARVFPHRDHAERCVLRALSPRRTFREVDRQDLEADGRRRRRATARPSSASTISSAMPAAEVVAVNQCSGNRRGLFQPHVPGVEWGYGAMGCARWKGARLKDVLDKVGLKKEAIEIVFNGADGPVARQDARLRQEHSGLEGDRGHHPHRLRDERRSAAAFQRLSGAPHRAGLDRHLLDEAPHLDQGGDQAARRLLDERRPTAFRSANSRSWRASSRRRPRPTRRSPRWWSTR